MALDASPSRIGREHGDNPLIGDSHAEPPTPQQLITATAIPPSLLNQLPDEIRRKLRNQAWSLIPPRQSDLFRYQHSAMFWVKTNKRWQQVSYAQYRQHTDECYAFAPYQALDVDNNTPKFAGGGGANNVLNATNPITSQGGQITNAVQSALATNNASTSTNGLTGANTFVNNQNNKRGLTQAEINQRFLGASVDPEQALEPHVFINKPNQGEQIELKKSAQVYMRFSQHTMTPADTVESVAKQYTGQADAGLVYPYNFNEGFTRRNPPQAGDTIKVPSGWDTHVEGSITNASSVEVSWQGASSGSKFISLPKPPPDQMRYWETRLTLDPGLYQLTAVASGAEHSIDIEVLGVKTDTDWVKVQAYYDDIWQTPLPLENVNISIDNNAVQENIALNPEGEKSTTVNDLSSAEATAEEAGVTVQKDLPQGQVLVEVARNEALEGDIEQLRQSLQMQLDGAYRDTVSSMSGFQSQWDSYGYAAIAMGGMAGLYQGGGKWLGDQADLFEAQTWIDLGSTMKAAAGSAYDTTAEYASEKFDQLRQSANELSEWAEDGGTDDLLSWNWYQANAEAAIDAATEAYADAVQSASQYVEDAADAIEATTDYAQALLTHHAAILALFDDIAKGDVNKVERFVDTVLMDIDPELAEQIKNSPDFHLVLALIEDHDSALTYIAYLSLFMEAVPPNFYAFVAGKGSAYLTIEVCLLILTTFFTLGVGTAARVTTLAAKLAASSAKAAGANQKINKAQAAITAFSKTVEDFANSAETLKNLGKKLTQARAAGLTAKGKTNSTLTAKKETTKRETKCRLCKKSDHTTPRSLRGMVDYE
ncbi:hypothetical protein DXX93_10340 [Thalassotalea euphylliae]|uniref:Uncharacterized protein n=1 Tax=Thalassotalea euphylliae TaxID=1655234 RepID=A0A3E0TR17_9GAMM|nr:hypothetical protein [Thalassotalea euphylliae]REL26928.1 hypothetical protein DXX93_10340 [Thalassotalea euphylliae]